MKSFLRPLLVSFFLLARLSASPAETVPTPLASPTPWQTRLPAFSADAPPRGSAPLLLYFTAPWCGFCKQMDRTTLADPEVNVALTRFRAHKLDFDTQTGLVTRLGVRGIPAFIITNDRGEVLDRLSGAVPTADFLAWLATSETAAARHALDDEARSALLSALPSEAQSSDPATQTKAQETLWNLAARGTPTESKTTLAILTTLLADPERAPAVWQQGLLHPDLAVRITAANLLRTLRPTSPAIIYDPWTDSSDHSSATPQL